MLKLTIPKVEFYNEKTSEFDLHPEIEIELEHSLVSLSKWESKFEKPFLSRDEKTSEEVLSYIVMMAEGQDFDYRALHGLTEEQVDQINEYIQAKMTATWFSDEKNSPSSREIVTSEIIYYWMLSLNIPFECQHWHLNRLLTLIKVCNQKNQPPKKLSKSELANRNRAINEARRAKLGTKG